MGIFSGIFSKNTESNSIVRKWAAGEMEQVDAANPQVYKLFAGVIHAAVRWGKDSGENEKEQFSQVAKQYLGDATLFEVACYTYYRIESWLAENHPGAKSEITPPISRWIIERFYTALYVDERKVRQVFEEQVDRYAATQGAENRLEEVRHELQQRILSTKGDKFDKQQVPKDAARDCQYIARSIENYDEKHIPAVLADVEECCKKNRKAQVSQRESQMQNQQQGQEHKDYIYGMALMAQEDWVRACTAFTKVLTANPEHYDALVQRGLLYRRMFQSVEAVKDFSKAIEVNPDKAAAYVYRGGCYHRNFRQKDKALADYTKAIELEPRNATAYFGRAELYDAVALAEDKKALENNDTGKLAQVSEEFLAAIEDYSEVIDLEPEHDEAYANRGLAYARKARANKNADFIVKAIEDLEKAIQLNWENGYLYKQQDELKELLKQVSSPAGQTE